MDQPRETQRAPEVLRAQRFELVDEDGDVLAILGDLDRGGDGPMPGLSLRDASGSETAVVAVNRLGSLLSLALGGNTVAEFGARTADVENVSPGAYLVLCDGYGRPIVRWEVGPDGSVTASASPE